VLAQLPAGSVQTVCTSPPYFGLRDYGTGQWEGGDATCDHIAPLLGGIGRETITGGKATQHETRRTQYKQKCGKCGAVRVDRQLGLEASVDEYIANMVDVFRGVWRVLHPTGTLWVNLGDSYSGSGKGPTGHNGIGNQATRQGFNGSERTARGLPAKNLMMIPARLALALQADGWILRSDIAWIKTAPMPESVQDRPTSAWEHIFLLTKQQRYYYDNDAVREPHARLWNDNNGGTMAKVDHAAAEAGLIHQGNNHRGPYPLPNPAGRNLWNYWTLSPEPFEGSHFAVMPTEIPRRAILAGTSERGCCPACGAGWVRVVEHSGTRQTHGVNKVADMARGRHGANSAFYTGVVNTTSTTGWQPSCQCPAHEPIPCTVLDPFLGSGTTMLVARQLGRASIGIELNPTYAQMAEDRIRNAPATFDSLAVELPTVETTNATQGTLFTESEAA
jgi:DNA modification methylase